MYCLQCNNIYFELVNYIVAGILKENYSGFLEAKKSPLTGDQTSLES
jgi:hypothetical protein